MQFPGLTNSGRSVPNRWAIKTACSWASFRDEHKWPRTSFAGRSHDKSKKIRTYLLEDNPLSTLENPAERKCLRHDPFKEKYWAVITRDSQHTADGKPRRAQAGAVLRHEMAKSKKATAEPIGVGFKASDELTLPISSKPDPRLIVLVRILARQAARDFVHAACDGQERNSRHLNISERQQVSMESARPDQPPSPQRCVQSAARRRG